MVIGLTRDEVIDILGPPQVRGWHVTPIPGVFRASEYYMGYYVGTFYEWSLLGPNYRRWIRLVLAIDEKEETVASTFMVRTYGSDQFVALE